jgi:hypothetical protein
VIEPAQRSPRPPDLVERRTLPLQVARRLTDLGQSSQTEQRRRIDRLRDDGPRQSARDDGDTGSSFEGQITDVLVVPPDG